MHLSYNWRHPKANPSSTAKYILSLVVLPIPIKAPRRFGSAYNVFSRSRWKNKTVFFPAIFGESSAVRHQHPSVLIIDLNHQSRWEPHQFCTTPCVKTLSFSAPTLNMIFLPICFQLVAAIRHHDARSPKRNQRLLLLIRLIMEKLLHCHQCRQQP